MRFLRWTFRSFACFLSSSTFIYPTSATRDHHRRADIPFSFVHSLSRFFPFRFSLCRFYVSSRLSVTFARGHTYRELRTHDTRARYTRSVMKYISFVFLSISRPLVNTGAIRWVEVARYRCFLLRSSRTDFCQKSLKLIQQLAK